MNTKELIPRWLVWALFCLAAMCLISVGNSIITAADANTWINTTTPALQKLAELPANTPPMALGTDCVPYSYQPPGFSEPTNTCTYTFALGTLTTNNRMVTGTSVTLPKPFRGYSSSSYFLNTMRADYALLALSGTNTALGVYLPGSLTMRNVVYVPAANVEPYYYVPKQPDLILKDTAGQPYTFSTASIGFSTNGRWMVVNVPGNGVMRYDTDTWQGKLFAPPIRSGTIDTRKGPGTPNLAVSDDGKYAAVVHVTPDGNSPALEVYDVDSCTDLQTTAQNKRTYCQYKDIWNGLRGTNQVDGGIKSIDSSLVRPLNVRFVTDDTVSFNALYDYQSGSVYKAATFVATVSGIPIHQLGVLGIGDSYISGEGEFMYRDGTNTDDNKCHLSDLSYPMLLGKKYYDSYNSIACSGAKIADVTSDSDTYGGQTVNHVSEKNRGDKTTIFTEFTPGLLGQTEFVNKYTPAVVVASIGGNDIGFSNILAKCVGSGTCYDTYEDRVELMNLIDSQYGGLVDLYQSIRHDSNGGRVYIMGYPQVVKPNGDCGANVLLNADETVFASELISYLDGVIKRAADTAGVVYVDTQHAFDGYRLCEAPKGESAVNGVTAGDDNSYGLLSLWQNIIGKESYHPTQFGHEVLAKTLDDATLGLTKVMPVPTNYSQPVFDSSNELLAGVIKSGRTINLLYPDDNITADSVMVLGQQGQLQAHETMQIAPNGEYTFVIHSQAETLASGTADADGNISTAFTIPQDIEPGFHTLDLYTKNLAGESIDIQKVVYVGKTVDDLNGDGVPDSSAACGALPASGMDEDKDGIDDACDPDITNPPADTTSSSGTDQSNQGPDAPINSPADKLLSPTHDETVAPLQSSHMNSANVQINTVSSTSQPTVTLSTTRVPVDEIAQASVPDEAKVLGDTTAKQQPAQPQEQVKTLPKNHSIAWLLGSILFVGGCILAGLKLRAGLSPK